MEKLVAILDFLFGCHHGHLSRVFTIDGRTYRVCCACGAAFGYSLESMRMEHRFRTQTWRKNMTSFEIVPRTFSAVRPHWKANLSSKPARTAVIVGIVLAAALAVSAEAQESVSPQPPAIGSVLAGLPSDEPRIAAILASQPQEPIGPGDLLNNYEQGMAFISQQTYIELAQIAEAARQGQIGREQAEHLSYEVYQSGIMQFQLLSTLHQILESDMVRAAQRSGAPQLRGSAGSLLGAGQAAASRAVRESQFTVQGPAPLTQ